MALAKYVHTVYLDITRKVSTFFYSIILRGEFIETFTPDIGEDRGRGLFTAGPCLCLLTGEILAITTKLRW
jgi:hypothetical protein